VRLGFHYCGLEGPDYLFITFSLRLCRHHDQMLTSFVRFVALFHAEDFHQGSAIYTPMATSPTL
jgi:hypothetical protein